MGVRGKSRASTHAVAVACALALFVPACAEDTILPAPNAAECGDGEVSGDETCDTTSEGCVDCQIQPGWECPDNACASVCGDGLVVGEEECDSDTDPNCDSACHTGSRPAQDCDLTGWWAIQQFDFPIDNVVNALQTSSTYYVEEYTQSGDAFTVTRGLFCGVIISGSADVNLTEAGIRSLLYQNPRADHPTQGARGGTSRQVGDQCEISAERWYSVRGVGMTYLPTDFRARPDLQTLPPLPSEPDPEHPGPTPTGAEDWDRDGVPGLMWVLTGNANGKRSTLQRDWTELFPDPEFPVQAGALEFVTRGAFGTQENILALLNCPPIGCGVVGASGTPSQTVKSRTRMRYLGQELSDPRVSAIVVAPPGEDEDNDFETCLRLRTSMPHQDSRELGLKK